MSTIAGATRWQQADSGYKNFGRDAINIADKIFRPYSGRSLKEMKGYTAAYGDVFDGETKLTTPCPCFSRAQELYGRMW